MNVTHEKAQQAADPQDRIGIEDLPTLHYYWPSEFPVAVCGAVSSLAALPPLGTIKRGVVCETCAGIRAQQGGERKNPHQGPEAA